MIHRYHLLFLLTFTLSCQSGQSTDSTVDLEELPVVQPQSILEVEQAGEYFFQHLNYSSVALHNGNVIINDRPQGIILRISPDGELLETVAQQGRGPGEIQDASALNTDPDENLVIFDQSNQKVVRYRSDGSGPEEFMPAAPEEYRVRSVFALAENNHYLVVQWSPSALIDENRNYINRLRVYNRNSESYTAEHTYPGRDFAQLLIDGQVRGGAPVPFVPEFHFSLSNNRETLFVTWTENNEIAEINTRFDTLRTIDVPYLMEQLTKNEIDSLEQEFSHYHPNQWRTIEEKLPGVKMGYDGMLVDHRNRIWLKLTRQSAHQEWLILSAEGDPEKRVQLPKEGMLTHVSEHHLGFREDDHKFALYEAVE